MRRRIFLLVGLLMVALFGVASAANAAINVSSSSNRSGAIALNGSTLSGTKYVFSTTPPAGTQNVQWFIKTMPSGSFVYKSTDSSNPYDYKGGTATVANPWNTTDTADGSYQIKMAIKNADNTITNEYATFTIDNVPNTTCTKYASLSGNDSTGTGTIGSPYRTVSKLSDMTGSGGVGCLRAGTYSETPTLNDAGVTLMSYPGEQATIAPSGELRVTANNVKLDELSIAGTGTGVMMWVNGADNFVLEDSYLTNPSGGSAGGTVGSCIYAGGGLVEDMKVLRNHFEDCGIDPDYSHGIYLGDTDQATITDNVIWNAGAWGIQVYPNADNSMITHNVIDGNEGGLVLGSEGSATSTGNTISQNILSNNPGMGNYSVYWGGPTGSATVTSNCTYNGGNIYSASGTTISGNVSGNPMYVNAANGDFRLGAGNGCLATVGYDTADKID